MTTTLTVHNATLQTASVEIQTLTISGKQVTLAVFRQLRETELIDERTGELNGAPWGYVNYHPDKCGDSSWQHIHVIWQSGTELLRSAIRVKPSYPKTLSSETADHFLTACVWEYINDGGTAFLDNDPLPLDQRSRTRAIRRAFEMHGLLMVADASSKASAALEAYDGLDARQTSRWSLERFEDANKQLEAEYQQIGKTADQLYTELDRNCLAENARRDKIQGISAELLNLPQLFIAV